MRLCPNKILLKYLSQIDSEHSVLHNSCLSRPAVDERLKKAGKAFWGLWKSMFGLPDIPIYQKSVVYKSAIWGVLLFGSETWTLTRADEMALELFHSDKVRKICSV